MWIPLLGSNHALYSEPDCLTWGCGFHWEVGYLKCRSSQTPKYFTRFPCILNLWSYCNSYIFFLLPSAPQSTDKDNEWQIRVLPESMFSLSYPLAWWHKSQVNRGAILQRNTLRLSCLLSRDTCKRQDAQTKPLYFCSPLGKVAANTFYIMI